MKIYIYTFFLLIPFIVQAQTTSENFIVTKIYKEATTNIITGHDKDKVMSTVQYFDGLGRSKQTVNVQAGGNTNQTTKDIITHYEYDDLGRQKKEYLPYARTSSNGAIITGNIPTAINNYYKTKFPLDINSSAPNPFSKKEFDNSPLNRVMKQAAPGYDWRLNGGHEIKFDYDTNTNREVKVYYVTTTFANNTYTPTLQLNTSSSNNNGYYYEEELYKTTTKDENWQATQTYDKDHTIEEFKNKQGQVVLKRTYNNNQPHDTYYVYDDFGNLTYVLPPKIEATTSIVTTSKLNDLGYQYKYDYRNRLVEKKIPGKGWEYIVYDKLDRPVLTQDANLKVKNKWLFTRYDAFGRIVYTGFITNGSSRIQLQNSINNHLNDLNDSTTNSVQNIAGTNIFYTNTLYQYRISELHTINYYDTYIDLPTDLGTTITTSYNQTSTTRTKGLPTVNKVRVLNTNSWITIVTYYDEKARPIYLYSKNDYLNSIDIVENKLDDFTGKVLETKTTHTIADNDPIITVDRFEYDHMDRIISQKQQINNQPQEVIVSNSYDELGQLKRKEVGGKVNQNRLQKVDYKYNIRGWLTNINQDNHNDNDLFNFSIGYNNTNLPHNKRLYNGNIAKTTWQTQSADRSQKSYVYSYDALNRITDATGETNHNYDLWGITYDKNGNILTLGRDGHVNENGTLFGPMDDLEYTYDNGNKLLAVEDNENQTYGFKDGNVYGNDYSYDANGNLKSDKNKGITNITYNHLNLPTIISFGEPSRTRAKKSKISILTPIKQLLYVYDANGNKLEKINKGEYGDGIVTQYVGNYIYDKFHFRGNESINLQFFNHPEGYVKNDNGTFKYIYQYKDHLGNVRLSYTDNNNDGVITPSTEIIEESNYYPFGLKHKGYNGVKNIGIGNHVAQKFGYNGVELEEGFGLNLYEMDVRSYDPTIARWTSIDPVAHFSYSTYNTFDNNPIFYADPSGADSESFEDFVNRLFRTSTSKITWTNDGNGIFSDGNGNTEECERCKELQKQRKELIARISELEKDYHGALKYEFFTEDLTTSGAVKGILLEYANKIKSFTDEQLEYLEKNPDKVNKVIKDIIKESIKKSSGIPFATPNTSTNQQIGNVFMDTKDRFVLIMNLANKYVSTSTQIMHKAARANTMNVKRKMKNAHNNLNNVNSELQSLQQNDSRGFSGGFGGGSFGGGGASGSWQEKKN
ncbi:DUF6443 domain-containing protein [Aquimarina rhabdastrellae]